MSHGAVQVAEAIKCRGMHNVLAARLQVPSVPLCLCKFLDVPKMV